MGYWCDNDVDDWGKVCWYDGDQDEFLTCYECYVGESCELCYEDEDWACEETDLNFVDDLEDCELDAEGNPHCFTYYDESF